MTDSGRERERESGRVLRFKKIKGSFYSPNSYCKFPQTCGTKLFLTYCDPRLRKVSWVARGHTGAELVAGSAKTQRSLRGTRPSLHLLKNLSSDLLISSET